ncbi:MAG: hypothetical protein DLM50_07330 [Candidatus Meridianibacter frigidus]|nr:MAG: hypothetical protein DLM50_07330 [Candidatus Eremiobacteraeota bacterium]
MADFHSQILLKNGTSLNVTDEAAAVAAAALKQASSDYLCVEARMASSIAYNVTMRADEIAAVLERNTPTQFGNSSS